MAKPDTTTDWPEGVIGRYLTAGGATVDLTRDPDRAYYRCTGCGASNGTYGHVEQITREYAQAHAEKCRALPMPN